MAEFLHELRRQKKVSATSVLPTSAVSVLAATCLAFCAPSSVGAAPEPAAHPAGQTLAVPAPAVVSPTLQAALASYNESPDQQGFDRLVSVMKDVLVQPPLRDLEGAVIVKNHPALGDLGARVLDAGGAKVWAFNKCPFAQTVIILTGHPAAPAPPGKAPAFPAAYRAQLLSLPPSVAVTAAKIVTKSAPAPVKVVKIGKGAHARPLKRPAAPAAATGRRGRCAQISRHHRYGPIYRVDYSLWFETERSRLDCRARAVHICSALLAFQRSGPGFLFRSGSGFEHRFQCRQARRKARHRQGRPGLQQLQDCSEIRQ